MADQGEGFAPDDGLAVPKVTVYVEQYRDWGTVFVSDPWGQA